MNSVLKLLLVLIHLSSWEKKSFFGIIKIGFFNQRCGIGSCTLIIFILLYFTKTTTGGGEDDSKIDLEKKERKKLNSIIIF